MTATIQYYLLRIIKSTLAATIFFIFVSVTHAAEIYTPGIYIDSPKGNQYIVSGAKESNGRTLWTIVSAHNSISYFSGIWETGPAVGNTILAGNQRIVKYPNGYSAGRSYGVVGSSNFSNSSWFQGQFLAASQTGNSITLLALNNNGSTQNQLRLNLVKPSATISTTTEQYVSGIYRDIHGYGYLISGAPSQAGRTIWTIVSLPDNPNLFNASWETGAAVGNSLLAGNPNISRYPAAFAEGRSYGVTGTTMIEGLRAGLSLAKAWGDGHLLAVAQTGNTISLSTLLSNVEPVGSTQDQFVLVKDNSNYISYGSGSEDFRAGYYRSKDGKRYLIAGSSEARGRTLWTIASVSMPTTFNATWETGPATGNSLLANGSFIKQFSEGYASGRSYGIIGDNSDQFFLAPNSHGFGPGAGTKLAVTQIGNTISLNAISNNGATGCLLVLTKESETDDVIGTDNEAYTVGSDYQDVRGGTYTVSVSGKRWSIQGAGNFNAQWEAGPTTTNSLFDRNSEVVRNFNNRYQAGRSYGLLAGSHRAISAAQTGGNTISIAKLNGQLADVLEEFSITKGGTGGIGNAGEIAFASATYYVNKFDDTAKIGVTRTGGGTGMVSVMYSTADGTSHSGSSYTPVSGGTLAWNTGDISTKYISIRIPKTATGGTDFTITLNNPVGGAIIGQQATATVSIFDNVVTAAWQRHGGRVAYDNQH